MTFVSFSCSTRQSSVFVLILYEIIGYYFRISYAKIIAFLIADDNAKIVISEYPFKSNLLTLF